RLTTIRMAGAPTRTSSARPPLTITASISLPGSRLPASSPRSSDQAAFGAALVHVHEMVSGARPHPRGDAGAAARRELVGVHTRHEAGPASGFEDLDRLLRGEDAPFAEHIAVLGQALLRDAREHLLDDE